MRASPHLSKQVPHRCLCLLVCNGNGAVIQLVLHIKWGPALMHQTWCKHGSRNACTLILTLRSDLLNSSPELHNTLHKRTHAHPPSRTHTPHLKYCRVMLAAASASLLASSTQGPCKSGGSSVAAPRPWLDAADAATWLIIIDGGLLLLGSVFQGQLLLWRRWPLGFTRDGDGAAVKGRAAEAAGVQAGRLGRVWKLGAWCGRGPRGSCRRSGAGDLSV